MTPALSDRVAAASGPSRELFLEAFYAIFGSSIAGTRNIPGPDWAAKLNRFCELLDVDAWIDAAMSLVPEGLAGIVSIDFGYARLEREDGEHWSSDAATPALALCAAALRARGEQP